MTDPPLKTNRGGHCVATPNRFEPTVDDTPLVCGAQTWCEHENTRIERLANGPHYAKEVCTDCGATLRFVPKPQTIQRQSLNSLRILKLTMADHLSAWEKKFIKNIAPLKKLSPKQQAKLDELFDKFRIGGRR